MRVGGKQQRKMTPIFEYLKVILSFHWFNYKHLAFLDIQRYHSPVATGDTEGTVGGSRPHSVSCGVRVDWGIQRSAFHRVSSFCTPHRVSALFTSCFSSSGFSVMWMTSVRPLLPRTQGTLRKTSSFTPCIPYQMKKGKETAKTALAGHLITSAECTVCKLINRMNIIILDLPDSEMYVLRSSPGPVWTQGALCAGSSWCFPPGQPQTYRWPRKCSPSAW